MKCLYAFNRVGISIPLSEVRSGEYFIFPAYAGKKTYMDEVYQRVGDAGNIVTQRYSSSWCNYTTMFNSCNVYSIKWSRVAPVQLVPCPADAKS